MMVRELWCLDNGESINIIPGMIKYDLNVTLNGFLYRWVFTQTTYNPEIKLRYGKPSNFFDL